MTSTRQFWLRKIHSLTGGVFLTLFLVLHIFIPGSNVLGRGFLGTLFLFSMPLFFHVIYGCYLVHETQWPRYSHLSNWRYLLQRSSALVIAAFLPLHVYVMTAKPAWIHLPVYRVVWVVGTLVTLYHLINGFGGLLIHWGITVGSKSQKVVLIALAVIYLMVSLRALAGIAELTGALSFMQPIRQLLF